MISQALRIFAIGERQGREMLDYWIEDQRNEVRSPLTRPHRDGVLDAKEF